MTPPAVMVMVVVMEASRLKRLLDRLRNDVGCKKNDEAVAMVLLFFSSFEEAFDVDDYTNCHSNFNTHAHPNVADLTHFYKS